MRPLNVLTPGRFVTDQGYRFCGRQYFMHLRIAAGVMFSQIAAIERLR